MCGRIRQRQLLVRAGSGGDSDLGLGHGGLDALPRERRATVEEPHRGDRVGRRMHEAHGAAAEEALRTPEDDRRREISQVICVAEENLWERGEARARAPSAGWGRPFFRRTARARRVGGWSELGCGKTLTWRDCESLSMALEAFRAAVASRSAPSTGEVPRDPLGCSERRRAAAAAGDGEEPSDGGKAPLGELRRGGETGARSPLSSCAKGASEDGAGGRAGRRGWETTAYTGWERTRRPVPERVAPRRATRKGQLVTPRPWRASQRGIRR